MHQRGCLCEPAIYALIGVVRDERRRLPLEREPVGRNVLYLDWGRLPRRVPVHLPHHVPRAARALEPGRVDRAAVREVADQRVGVRVEGAGGVRGGRDADAVVVPGAALAMRGVCMYAGRSWGEESAGVYEGAVASGYLQYMT